jgi:hypothetical protein
MFAKNYRSLNLSSYLNNLNGNNANFYIKPKIAGVKLISITFTAQNTGTGTIVLNKESGSPTYVTIPSAKYTLGQTYTVYFNYDLNTAIDYTVQLNGGAAFPINSATYTTNSYINTTTGSTTSLATATGVGNIVIGYTDGKQTIINSILTSSTGTATGTLAPAGDYNALLYTTAGVLNNTYQKTTVTVNKPLNEKTLAAISPYDLYVGGLLTYSITNQTAATQTVNIFGGTTSVYDFSVVDYNSVLADRKYVQRNYAVNNPWGSSYVPTYSLQPYLVLVTDAVIPLVYTIDILKRPIEDVLIDVYGTVGGVLTLLESHYTDSVGSMSFSAYPLDSYTLKAYYAGLLKGTYRVVPRSSSDIFYIVLDLYSDLNFGYYPDLTVTWTTKDNYDLTTEDIIATGNILINSADPDYNITSYTLSTNQGGAVLSTGTTVTSGGNVNFTKTFAKTLYDSNINYANILLTVNYTFNGVAYTQSFSKVVGVRTTTTNILTVMQAVPTDLGHLWTILNNRNNCNHYNLNVVL